VQVKANWPLRPQQRLPLPRLIAQLRLMKPQLLKALLRKRLLQPLAQMSLLLSHSRQPQALHNLKSIWRLLTPSLAA